MKLLILIVIILLFTNCAETSPHAIDCVTGNPHNFLSGLMHGFVLPFALIFSLLDENVAIYAYDNIGAWYDFGYVCGVFLMCDTCRSESKITKEQLNK